VKPTSSLATSRSRRVVETDPFESAPDAAGGRALLNLGHTFAHAIETLPGLTLTDDTHRTLGISPILHGEAVGLGLIASASSAREEGHCEPDLIDRLKRLMQAAGLPTFVNGLPSNKALMSRMMHDKKVQGGQLRVILPAHQFRAKVYTVTEPTLIAEGWDAVRGD
jgi:3-dehydroquinate synthetase